MIIKFRKTTDGGKSFFNEVETEFTGFGEYGEYSISDYKSYDDTNSLSIYDDFGSYDHQ